jgi:hypothetical protein
MAKCVDCGFLSLRLRKGRALVEAEVDYREKGSRPSEGNTLIYEDLPICFVMAFDLASECKSADRNDLIAVMKKERDCQSSTAWLQGFSPKEHREMLNEKMMREWQANREDADRAWRNQQAEDERKWREHQAKVEADRYAEQRADEHRRHRIDLFVMGGIVTGVGVIAQLIAAWISGR